MRAMPQGCEVHMRNLGGIESKNVIERPNPMSVLSAAGPA
jgi:hypothetical protein